MVPIPQRGLLVTAEEADLGDVLPGTLTIYKRVQGKFVGTPEKPTLESNSVSEPWAALSGLAAHPHAKDTLFSVPDNALKSAIYRISLLGPKAKISEHGPIRLDGQQAAFDLEGLAIDSSIAAPRRQRGFWLANEGNGDFQDSDYSPNLLIQTDYNGNVLQQIKLPDEIDSAGLDPDDGTIRGNGFEGVTVSSKGRYLLAVIQRQFRGEDDFGGVLHTRIARYDLEKDEWDFFLYPLGAASLDPEGSTEDWIGLSDIDNLGHNTFAVIERDKMVGALANVKQGSSPMRDTSVVPTPYRSRIRSSRSSASMSVTASRRSKRSKGSRSLNTARFGVCSITMAGKRRPHSSDSGGPTRI